MQHTTASHVQCLHEEDRWTGNALPLCRLEHFCLGQFCPDAILPFLPVTMSSAQVFVILCVLPKHSSSVTNVQCISTISIDRSWLPLGVDAFTRLILFLASSTSWIIIKHYIYLAAFYNDCNTYACDGSCILLIIVKCCNILKLESDRYQKLLQHQYNYNATSIRWWMLEAGLVCRNRVCGSCSLS